MKITLKLTIFFVLSSISIDTIGQLTIPIYSKNGNAITLSQIGSSNCSNPNEVTFYTNYMFPSGMSLKGKWLNWKHDFINCNGDVYVQEFYTPLCGVGKASYECFQQAYVNEQTSFVFELAECVYPNKISKFKEFSGSPYDVIEVYKPDDFLPSNILPKSKCENPVFNASINNINSISINWAHNPNWLKTSIRYRESNNASWNEVNISAPKNGQNTYTINNLKLDTSYEIQIGVSCNNSSSLFYSNSQFTRTQKSQCPIPDQVRVEHAFADSLTITWKAIKTSKYTFEYREKNKTNWTTLSAQTNKVTLTGLKFDTNYEIKVAAFDNFGQGPFSNAYTIISATNPAPSIYGLRSQFNNPNEILVEWNTTFPASSEIYKNDIIYDCYLTEIGNPNNVIKKSTTFKKTTFSGLKYDTEYQIETQSMLLGKWKGERSKPLTIKTEKITKTLSINSNSTFCDSLTITLLTKDNYGAYYKLNEYKFKNQKSILTKLEFSKNSGQYPFKISVSYNGIDYPSYSVPISLGISDTIQAPVNMPIELLTIFEKSQRKITEYINQKSFLQFSLGPKASINTENNKRIFQPELTISWQRNKLSINANALFNFNKTQNIRDNQFFSNYNNVTLGYCILNRQIQPQLKADRRFNFFSLFSYHSLKKINPEYNMSGEINCGLLNTQNNYLFNLYNISNYSRNSICSNQTINSFDFGLRLNFSSNYLLSYFQKGFGKKLASPEFGEVTKRVSQIQISLDYFKPINGTMQVDDLAVNASSLIKMERKDITDGFKFNIQHTYNIRNSNLTITKGVSFYRSNHYYTQLTEMQSSNTPVIAAFIKLGWTNLR